MKQYLFALAGVVAATALASDPSPRTGDIVLDGFENYTAGQSVASVSASDNWTGSTDAVVTEYGEGEAPTGIAFPTPFTDAGDQYLAIDTGSDEVTCSAESSAATVYIDTLAQFSVLKAGESAPEADDAKLLLWLQEDIDDGVTTTNLHVRGGYYGDLDNPTPKSYKLNAEGQPGVWYRVTIKSYKNIANENIEDWFISVDIPAFVISIDGNEVSASEAIIGSGDLSDYCPSIGGGDASEDCFNSDILALIQANKLIPAMGRATSATVSQIAFKGNGAIDDLVVSANDPSSFLLSWPAGLTSVSYSLGQDPAPFAPLTPADGSSNITAVAGTSITLTGSAGFLTKTVSGTVTAGGSLSLPDLGIVYFFPQTNTAGQDGTADHPYEIADEAGLKALQAAVSAGVGANLCYVQTLDINMANAGPFEGIGTYADNPTNGVPFVGTYDGDGYKISNVTFTDRAYAGIFNQVNGPGTIKNLTVEDATFVGEDTTKSYSASIIGNAGNGATLLNLVAAGSFGSANKPGNHNMAGIAIRLSGGGSGTLVKDCTNNAAIYGTYTKLGGICAITQHKVAGEAVTFDGCVNNGTLTMPSGSTAGRDGLAGIVAYSADDTALTNCVNAGTMSTTLANATNVAELVGYQQSYSLLDQGGNKADASKAMLGEGKGATVTGFKYATVESGIATTVLPPLAVGNTYLLEGSVAASETPVATLASGETISFDTALGYSFAGNVAAEAPLVAIPSTSGTLITYSAGYFPRTATAGQDGSAEHPFELADADDLVALKAAFAADASYRSLNYKVVANIDATSLGYWDGIGTQGTANSGLNGGTLDGDGHTISNLKFSTGKYRGFFNRMDNATITNLTINVTDIQETTAAEHGYAAFVGNMKASKLVDCVATGTIGTTAKPAMHTCGGFAVKVDSAGVFVNCTNHIDIVCSLTDNPKIGGIVGLMQGGALTNCWNDGDITITCKKCANSANGAGGLIGYAQTSAVTIHHSGNAGTVQSTDTTANGGDADIKVGTIIGLQQSSTATITGDTTAQADATPAGAKTNVNGLNFATVDGNVATFVADAPFSAGNTYKVMLDGATATFAFTEAGTISFDTNLVQAVTFAITAAEGLTLTDATANGVVTYTAAGAGDDDYVVTINGSDVVVTPSAEDLAAVQAAVIAGGGTLDVTDVAAVNAALAAEIGSTGIPSWQALFLGLPPTEAGLESFKIDSISFNGDGNVVLTLPASVELKTGRGVNIALNLMGSDDLSSWTFIEAATGTTFAPVTPASGETKKFYKVVAVFSATDAE